MRLEIQDQKLALVGPSGSLLVPQHDVILPRLVMLYEGQCEGLGASSAARKHGLSRPRYYQLLARLESGGAAALQNQRRGPKTNYRRTDEVVRQVIRHGYLDREASPALIAQKLRQTNHPISQRSVERIIAEFGLQKKTLRRTAGSSPPAGAHPAHPPHHPRRSG
jgi:transposase